MKGYFNALPSVKLGVLTDGLKYELYSDTGRENMMDDEPFICIDLREVAEERVAESALDALQRLQKGTFDPADVGADARRKIYIASYVVALESAFKKQPNEAFVRALMDQAGVEGRRTSRLVEEHSPIVAEAMQVFFDKKLLERVGFAERQDLVRVSATPHPSPDTAIATATEDLAPVKGTDEAGQIVTTDVEREVVEYAKNRLAYLVDSEALFTRIHDVQFIDRKTVLTVFFRQERKGRLFSFREGSDPKYRFEFPDLKVAVATDDLREIDDPLLRIFRQRVEESG